VTAPITEKLARGVALAEMPRNFVDPGDPEIRISLFTINDYFSKLLADATSSHFNRLVQFPPAELARETYDQLNQMHYKDQEPT
jgi:hypothetical protein